MEIIYYPTPTQVRYWRKGVYKYGIAFHGYLIDIHDGANYSIKNIIDDAPFSPEEDAAIIEYGDWKDLSYNFDKI